MAFAPEINLGEIREYQLSQYADATRLNALLSAFIDIMQESVIDVLETINRGKNPDEAEGIFLDYIGTRLGFNRPRVEDNTREFWGLEGTRENFGRPLDQAPFWTADPTAVVYAPIQDDTFRSTLFARARKLHGDTGMEAWNDCFAALTRISGSMRISNVQPYKVTISIEDLSVAMEQILRTTEIAEKILPMSMGIDYVIRYERVTAGELGLLLDIGRPTVVLEDGKVNAGELGLILGLSEPTTS